MERVRTSTVTHDFTVDLRAALLRVLELFENQDPRALADNETIAVAFERTRRMYRIVVVGGKRAHRGEARDAHRRDRRLRAAADHHVGVAALNDLEAVANRVRAGRAGGRRRGVWPLRAETNRDLSGGEIDDGRNYKERRDAIRTVVEQLRVLAFDGPEVPDAAADIGAGVLGETRGKLPFRRHLNAAVGDGFDRRRNRVMNKGAHL